MFCEAESSRDCRGPSLALLEMRNASQLAQIVTTGIFGVAGTEASPELKPWRPTKVPTPTLGRPHLHERFSNLGHLRFHPPGRTYYAQR